MARRRDKGEEREVAAGRIDELLSRGRAEILAGRAELADRYGSISLRIAEKYQTGLRREDKTLLCRKCGALRCAASSRMRLRAGRITTTCLKCGAVRRRPLRRRGL